MTINENIGRFNSEGYVLIRNVFPPLQITAWREIFLTELENQKSRLLVDGILKYQEMRDVLETPQLLNAITLLLGKPFVVLPLSSVDHNRFGLYHTDTSGIEMRGLTFHLKSDFNVIEVGIYLQDNNEFGGGLRLVPGTHRLPDPYVGLLKKKHATRKAVDSSVVKRTLKKVSRGRLFSWQDRKFETVPGEIDIPTKAGDVIIWDVRIVHRASPNRTGRDGIPGGKIALFYGVGANSHPTAEYVEHIKKKEYGRGSPPRRMPSPHENYRVT